MRNKTILKGVLTVTLAAAITFLLPACTDEAATESTSPTVTAVQSISPEHTADQTVIPAPSPAPAPVGNFRVDEIYTTVNLPTGWSGAKGPESLAPRISGLAAFNSWGEDGFWLGYTRTANSYSFNPTGTVKRIPEAGAYVALTEIYRLPYPDQQPPEYAPNDLNELLAPHDWRQDISPSADDTHIFDFTKWGRRLRLTVACQAAASDATVAALNDLLQSWRFDEVPAGNPGWALLVALKLLPKQLQLQYFADQPYIVTINGVGVYKSEVKILPDKTVHFKFTYIWDLNPPPTSTDYDTSLYPNHWWEIDVLPTGEAVLTAQGGEPLPPAISP